MLPKVPVVQLLTMFPHTEDEDVKGRRLYNEIITGRKQQLTPEEQQFMRRWLAKNMPEDVKKQLEAEGWELPAAEDSRPKGVGQFLKETLQSFAKQATGGLYQPKEQPGLLPSLIGGMAATAAAFAPGRMGGIISPVERMTWQLAGSLVSKAATASPLQKLFLRDIVQGVITGPLHAFTEKKGGLGGLLTGEAPSAEELYASGSSSALLSTLFGSINVPATMRTWAGRAARHLSEAVRTEAKQILEGAAASGKKISQSEATKLASQRIGQELRVLLDNLKGGLVDESTRRKSIRLLGVDPQDYILTITPQTYAEAIEGVLTKFAKEGKSAVPRTIPMVGPRPEYADDVQKIARALGIVPGYKPKAPRRVATQPVPKPEATAQATRSASQAISEQIAARAEEVSVKPEAASVAPQPTPREAPQPAAAPPARKQTVRPTKPKTTTQEPTGSKPPATPQPSEAAPPKPKPTQQRKPPTAEETKPTTRSQAQAVEVPTKPPEAVEPRPAQPQPVAETKVETKPPQPTPETPQEKVVTINNVTLKLRNPSTTSNVIAEFDVNNRLTREHIRMIQYHLDQLGMMPTAKGPGEVIWAGKEAKVENVQWTSTGLIGTIRKPDGSTVTVPMIIITRDKDKKKGMVILHKYLKPRFAGVKEYGAKGVVKAAAKEKKIPSARVRDYDVFTQPGNKIEVAGKVISPEDTVMFTGPGGDITVGQVDAILSYKKQYAPHEAAAKKIPKEKWGKPAWVVVKIGEKQVIVKPDDIVDIVK